MKYFILYTLDILNEDAVPIVIRGTSFASAEFIDLTKHDLSSAELVTFNSHFLIDFMYRHQVLLPKVTEDIFQMYKLANGVKTKYHKLPPRLVMEKVFDKYVAEKELLAKNCAMINEPFKFKDKEVRDALTWLYGQFIEIYNKINTELETNGERERYELVERPFEQLLVKRQYEGIFVDQRLLSDKIDSVIEELNRRNRALRFDYGIMDPKSYVEIQKVLADNKFRYLSRLTLVEKKSFWNLVKTGAETDKFLKILYDAYRLSFDLNSLIKITPNSDGKIYPVFDGSGTITPRTQVRMPHIQHMKKGSRDIVQAKKGFSLIYADYSQFEPGILGSLADDSDLIDYYNNKDIYAALSIDLFGKKDERSLCKIVFLCFMYGMSTTGLENLLQDFFKFTDTSKKESITKFFMKFSRLAPYKQELETVAASEKRMCSVMGNYRYTQSKTNRLPNKIKRWILSQRVQGTASLILKQAVIECCKDENIEFLIPMHDAALFQVPTEAVELKKSVIKLEFEKSMKYRCPKLTPKVSFKTFTE